MNRTTEPPRVTDPVASPAARGAAGCLSLFVLPWFLISLLFSFLAAGAPLTAGFPGTLISGMMLALFIPMVVVLGGALVSAVRGMKDGEIRFPEYGGTVLSGTVVAVFAVSLFSMCVSFIQEFFAGTSASTATLIGSIGASVFFVTMLSYFARAAAKRKKTRDRRRHTGPPKPPWTHPLARTEPANMIAEAAANQYNVIAVFGAVVLSLILWNPLPAMVAGGLELMYLALVPDTRWFRTAVDAKYLAMAEEQSKERRAEQLEYLEAAQVDRHRELVEIAEAAKNALEASQHPFDVGKLDRLIDHHLWLMELENYYSDQDDADRIAELVAEIESTEAQVDASSGRMRKAVELRLDVLRRRHRQLDRISDRVDAIRDQRTGVEDVLRLIPESALSNPDPHAMEEVDEVLLELEVAEEVVLDLHDEELELEQEIEKAAVAAASA